MKKIFIIIIFSCFFSCNIIAEEEVNSQIAQVKAQIDELEIAKVHLKKVIKANEPEIKKISQMINKLLKVEEELKDTIKKNIYKTMIAGNISVILEIQGSSNAGKLIDLGTWVVGKTIGVGMEKSNFFSGPAYYTKKMTQLNRENISLTVELKELYEASKKTDEEIQKHYDKHKVNELWYDSGLGTLGTIQYRMNLIVSKIGATLYSLKSLRTNHQNVLNQAKNELEITLEGIALLRDRYQELNKKDTKKEKKVDNKEEINKIKAVKREIKTIASDIIPPKTPDKCKNFEDIANNLLRTYTNLTNSYKKVYTSYDKKMNDYFLEKEDKLKNIEKELKTNLDNISKKYKHRAYYSPESMFYYYDRSIPFNTILSNIKNSNNEYAIQKRNYISKIKNFSSFDLSSTPGEKEEKELSKLTSDINTVSNAYHKLIYSDCSKSKYIEENIEVNEPIYSYADGIRIISGYKKVRKKIYTSVKYFPTTNKKIFKDTGNIRLLKEHRVISQLKNLKIGLINKITMEEKDLTSFEKISKESFLKIQKHFRKLKSDIQISLNEYIKNEKDVISFNNNYINQLNILLKKYENQNLLKRNNNNGMQNNYTIKEDWLLSGVDRKAASCSLLKHISNKIVSSEIQTIVFLEKNIKNLQKEKLTKLYIHSYAYVHFPGLTSQAENLKSQSDKLWEKRLQLSMKKNSISSNLNYLTEQIVNNRTPQLGLLSKGIFETIYNNQVKVAVGMTNLLKNTIVIVDSISDNKRIYKDAYKNNKLLFDNQLKKFKEELLCLGKDNIYNKRIITLFEELNTLLPKLKTKPTFINVNNLINQLENFKKEVANFAISDSSNYESQYKNLLNKYETYDKDINSKKEKIFSLDFEKLYKLLNEIYPLFEAHRYHLEDKYKANKEDKNFELIKHLYEKFSKQYSNKNLSSLMSLISDDWESTADGTTLMDLEETLDNSFSIFDEINCSIENLDIYKLSTNKYQISYVISIKGFIYDNDIEHFEKSSVREEVTIKDNKAKISKTLNGNFWPKR